ncbi:sensor histidine kinase [Spirillospora sp. CA-253888]
MPGDSTDRGTGLAGLRRYTWWSVPGVTAFLLVMFTADWITDPDLAAWGRAVSAVALAATVAAAVALLSGRLALLPAGAPAERRPSAGWFAAGLAGAAVLGAVPLTLHEYGLWAVAPAEMVAIIAAFLPRSRRLVLIACAAVGAALPGGIVNLVSRDAEPLYAWLFPPGLLCFALWMTLGPLWAWDTAERLNEARRLSAELAVKEERLRFAADLHDIQGHHLQVIALKGELAARLVESDPARAAEEMEQVRRLAADALRDTRAVVQGYRRTTLDDEIANAGKVLAAAGIDVRTDLRPADAVRLPPPTRHLLGLVMREATTNLLRHSRARHAEIGYDVTGGRARLRVTNDGASRPSAGGTGLQALTERLNAAGGELNWEHAADRFTVEALLPAEAA